LSALVDRHSLHGRGRPTTGRLHWAGRAGLGPFFSQEKRSQRSAGLLAWPASRLFLTRRRRESWRAPFRRLQCGHPLRGRTSPDWRASTEERRARRDFSKPRFSDTSTACWIRRSARHSQAVFKQPFSFAFRFSLT
jgi:hypothetical protein